ncbi:hypothetical protein D9613_011949 [Agrocybe pediades]|uniref:factor independent urate hydroxylase n=1 Tax=Agrocybe pediades TaxID=84607 RepID=A0A8H4QET5_9AGAR|nr:hypothetical protein D9613_011949 [Agrocybe pediades]
MKYCILDIGTGERVAAKNITCLLAKTSPHILSAEKYALQLGTFFVSKYAHIAKAWTAPPKDKLVGKVPAGIIDLLVLKYAGSAFENFYRDEYTTLVEVNDKSSSPPSTYTMCSPLFPYERPTDEKKVEFMAPLQKGEEGHAGSAALETFAVDESASVQATLYNMVQHVFAENASVRSVSYALPNKHYIPVDMCYLNIDNLTLPWLRGSNMCHFYNANRIFHFNLSKCAWAGTNLTVVSVPSKKSSGI